MYTKGTPIKIEPMCGGEVMKGGILSGVTLQPVATKVYQLQIRLIEPEIRKWIDEKLLEADQVDVTNILRRKYSGIELLPLGYDENTGIAYFLLFNPGKVSYSDVKVAVDKKLADIRQEVLYIRKAAKSK